TSRSRRTKRRRSPGCSRCATASAPGSRSKATSWWSGRPPDFFCNNETGAKMSQSQVRTYSAQARSTDTFGRVLCSARNHYFVVDGPVQNGCPGEAVNPGELFLAGVAACGVELVQVIAKEQQVTPSAIEGDIEGMVDRAKPVRPDVTR